MQARRPWDWQVSSVDWRVRRLRGWMGEEGCARVMSANREARRKERRSIVGTVREIGRGVLFWLMER